MTVWSAARAGHSACLSKPPSGTNGVRRSPLGSAVLLLIIRWDWRFYCWLPANNPYFTKDLGFLYLSYPALTMLLAVLLASACLLHRGIRWSPPGQWM